jgi:soluble P-type ATPase
MLELEIPGHGVLQLHHLVSDVNGTLAVDGALLAGVGEGLRALQEHLQLHLLTADTHGKQASIDSLLGLTATRIATGKESEAKAAYVHKLGAHHVVALGQGANDAGMLRAAALGICVLSPEGTSAEAMRAADVLTPDVATALGLLQNPRRLVATLRR